MATKLFAVTGTAVADINRIFSQIPQNISEILLSGLQAFAKLKMAKQQYTVDFHINNDARSLADNTEDDFWTWYVFYAFTVGHHNVRLLSRGF